MSMFAKSNFIEFEHDSNNIVTLEEIMNTMKNVKFDYVIANPPYGKCSRLVKKILVTICNAIQCENIISLNPPVGFEDCRNNLKDIYNLTPEEIKQAFPDAGLSSLSIGTLDTTREYDNNILIDLQHKIAAQEDAIYWVEQYNKGSNLLVEAVLNRNPTEESKEKINSKKYFLYGVWDLVGSSILTADRNCLVVNLNYDRKQLVWAGEVNKNGNDVYAFYLGSEQARNNFRDIFFANPTKGLFKMLRENSSELKQSRKGMWDMLIVLKGSHTWETINNHPLWSIDKDAAVCSVLNENDDGKHIVDIYNRWKELENENE